MDTHPDATAIATLQFPEFFTQSYPVDVHPYDKIRWEIRDAIITDKDGNVVFEQRGVEFPDFWSQTATNVVTSKYFRGALGAPDREWSVKQMIDRVVYKLTSWGVADGYFDEDQGEIFAKELIYLLVNQYGSFNSPVWFNLGVKDTDTQVSACFILSVEDSMPGILEWYRQEGMIFSRGSGAGVNVSSLRAKGEPISKGGTSSGPLSFMRAADASAFSIKSGGTTRRSARMVVMNADHPDIMEFIQSKGREEEKARALALAGFDDSLDGEIYATVAHQNCNMSVRLTDAFMRAVDQDGDWQTYYVSTGEKAKVYKAREVFRAIAEGTWNSGDPGVQFDTTMNNWNPVINDGRFEATNPCQPGHATVLTPQGIRTFDDIDVGSVIWSGKQWTRVTRKVATGVKKAFEYRTSAGVFIGTKEHRVISNGMRIEADDASTIDICVGDTKRYASEEFDAQSVIDGLVIGDGNAKTITSTARNPYILLCIGKKDQSYFSEESGVSDFINHIPFDRFFHRVKTTIEHRDLPHTYDRTVPLKYFYGSDVMRRSFLRGLYSANGSVVSNRVTLKASSFSLVSQVQEMLSSLGIASYYTTNKSHDVVFKNGTYTCKESYDLNISHGKTMFSRLIGFIQPYKQEKLDALCDGSRVSSKPPKSSFEVRSIKHIGNLPVYDITVDAEEHTYWTGGLLVSNCSEYVFLNNTACNLASLNLLNFLGDDGLFDTQAFQHAVNLFITAQEIMVSRASYPTPAIEKNSHIYRTLGLGYANLGAVLMAKGLPYDSAEGRAYAASITALMTGQAYAQSAELARVKGAFSAFEENRKEMREVIEKHIDALDEIASDRVADFPDIPKDLLLDVWEKSYCFGEIHGFRNAQVSLLAPCGTISFMMDCTTTGVEPDTSLVSYKKLVGGGTLKHINTVVPRALDVLGYNGQSQDICQHIATHGTIEGAPHLAPHHLSIFDCAFPSIQNGRAIGWEGHVRMVAAVQPFLSGGVSKTINMPNSSTIEDIENAYMLGWRLGCKSMAIYRDGCKQTQPVTTRDTEKEVAPVEAHHATPTSSPQRRRLPDERFAITHKATIGGHEFYVTVGLYDDGSPGEIFLHMAKEGSTISGLMDGFATAISMALQYGVPLEALVTKFSHMRFEPSGFTKNSDIPIAKSVFDYLFRWLGAKFLGKTFQRSDDQVSMDDTSGILHNTPHGEIDAVVCMECGSIMVTNGSCHKCMNCGGTSGCS